MKGRFVTTFGRILLIVVISGCSLPDPSETNPGQPISQDYEVEIINIADPIYETVSIEEIDQPNCKGTRDVDNVIERSRAINHTVELAFGLVVDADGKLELLGTGINLGVEIASELGYQYGVTESISRSVTVRAAPQTHMKHTIKLDEVWESGTARVTTNGQSLDIPFRFRANFSVDLVESIPVICDPEEIRLPSLLPTATPTSDPGFGMHVILTANQTKGGNPLPVLLDARETYFVALDGTIFECGACNYTWRIRTGGLDIYGPENTDGKLEFTFGNKGTYFVSVYVCRSGSDTDCAGSGIEIIVE
jgi:hypothetical protein